MKNIFKRGITAVTALALMFAAYVFAMPKEIAEAASTTSGNCGAEGDNVTWSYDASTGVLTISGEGAMEDFTYNDLSSEPPANTPWAQENITKIVVEDGVTHIGNCAFLCSSPTEMDITLPDSVKSIGDFAFFMNTLPKLPTGLQTIGDFAFCLSVGTSNEITLPPSVTSIGELAILPSDNVKKIYYYEGAELTKCIHSRIIVGTDPPSSLDRAVYYLLYSMERLQFTTSDDTFTVCKALHIEVGAPLPMPVFINETNFPDANFRSYLSSATVDKNQDGALSDEEIASVTRISVANKNIADLTGIALFTELKTLTCNGNKLTSLDVSENLDLETLNCNDNQLTSLNVSGIHGLTSLNCSNNRLTSLDVSEIDSLTILTCSNNQLTSLDVSRNSVLTSLTCSNNQLTSLDVGRTMLTVLTCTSNMYTVSGCIVDPATLPTGFKLSKASGWENCKLTDDNKILYLGTGNATYTYDCGNGQTAKFTLGFQPHNCTKVDKIPATGTTEGVEEHWHCDGCGKDFADKDGTTEMTETDLTIPVTGHTHTLTHVAEVPATETTNGTKEHWHCGGCGKDFADKDGTNQLTKSEMKIPALGYTGSCSDNASWAYDEETKTLTIEGTGDMTDWTDENPAPWSEIADEIEKVVIGDGITSIGDNAFEGCTGLTDVEIPDSVTSIGDNAFSGTGLTEVTIPENVESIGDGAFTDCGDLEKVTFEGVTPPALGEGAIGANVAVTVPAGSENAYKNAVGFGGIADNINGGGTPDPDTPDNPFTPATPVDPVTPATPATPDNSNNSNDSNDSSNSSDNSSTSASTANESKQGENVPNPPTGIAVSLVPITAALAFVTAAVIRKKK